MKKLLVTITAITLFFPQIMLADFVPADDEENAANTMILDADDTGGDVTLQFGGTLAEFLRWNSGSSWFEFSDETLVLDASNTGSGADVNIVANQGSDNDGTLRYNATSNEWELSNDGGTFNAIATGSSATELATVQTRRTTDYTLTNTFVDITLDTTDLENDATVIEHDNTNTDQIDIKEDGIYMIYYRTQVDVGGASLVRAYGRVRESDTTIIAGTEAEIDTWHDATQNLTATAVASLSSGDYLTLQLSKETTADAATAIADTVFKVTKMEGVEGAKGDQGDAGTGNLDAGYNNFGAIASSINVDAAESQTGGLRFIGSLASDETVTISNSAAGGVFLAENTSTGDSFRVNDEASDTSPFIIDDAGLVGIGIDTPASQLDIQGTGELVELGDGTAADSIINFDDGADRNFGWDDSDTAISTFDQQLRFRTIQSATPPATCSSTVAGMQWMDTDTGVLYICDTSNSRNKWLSASEMVIFGDESGNCSAGSDANSGANCNVDWGNGLGPDGGTDLGFYIPQDITITGYGFSEDNDACTSGSFDIEVWSTGSNADDNAYTFEADIASGLAGQAHNSNSLNVDIAGDQYTLWGLDNNCGQGIDDWNVVIYFRYKHD